VPVRTTREPCRAENRPTTRDLNRQTGRCRGPLRSIVALAPTRESCIRVRVAVRDCCPSIFSRGGSSRRLSNTDGARHVTHR